MGDRANVVVHDGVPSRAVYLYTHWHGSELPQILAKALLRGIDRWTDGQYLARIIFNEMTLGDELGTTGFGISASLCDNEHDLLVCDVEKQIVWVVPERQYEAYERRAVAAHGIPFADFAALAATRLGWGDVSELKRELGG